MRVLPLSLDFARSAGWLLIGIGVMVMIFAAREVDPWLSARTGAGILGTGAGLVAAVLVHGVTRRRREGDAADLAQTRTTSPGPAGEPSARDHA